jgi:S-adenosylmethionine uptake transporter
MIMACIVSSLNDVLTKHLGNRLPGTEVSFFRFFFGAILLLPFMLSQGKKSFATRYPTIQCIRALLLVLAMTAWSYGVAALPLALSTTISFTSPFFILPLTRIFLNEYVDWQRWLAALFGFTGIVVTLCPTGSSFNPMAFVLLVSTMIFATLDVMNKKLLVNNESFLSIRFYSAVGAAALGLIPTLLTWITPLWAELFFLVLLGGGSNLILFCLLKAFSATEISALQSFRYIEFILSVIFGIIIFHELPTFNTFLGIAIIIPSTFYIVIYEIGKDRVVR